MFLIKAVAGYFRTSRQHLNARPIPGCYCLSCGGGYAGK